MEELPKDEFNYHTVDRVTKFLGTHPTVMADAIAKYDYIFEHDRSQALWKSTINSYNLSRICWAYVLENTKTINFLKISNKIC